jgi:hypothetical protein
MQTCPLARELGWSTTRLVRTGSPRMHEPQQTSEFSAHSHRFAGITVGNAKATASTNVPDQTLRASTLPRTSGSTGRGRR